MENKVYHIGTKGLDKNLWFWDDEDYIDGMNSVPVCALEADVTIYCFCLMSNHVHFIVGGLEGNCVRFIREYKRRRSIQLAVKYNNEHSIQGSDIFMNQINTPEYMKTAVAYVMRNPMAAGIAVQPTDYPWSSSNLYFADRTFRKNRYKRIGELSFHKKRILFKSKIQFPDDYLIDCDGVIFPGCYVAYKSVEKLYHSPKQFLYSLSSTNDMLVELETGILSKASYKDSELIASMNMICEEKYHGKKFGLLKIEDRFLIAREMRKRYGVGPKQLARITALDYDSLKQML